MLPKIIKSDIRRICLLMVLLTSLNAISSYASEYSSNINRKLNTIYSSYSSSDSSNSPELRMIGYSKEDKVILTLNDNTGSFQSVIRYKTGATDIFDGRYDAYFWMGDPANSVLYSVLCNTQYSINSIPTTYNEGIQLILQTNSPENFSISYEVTCQLEGYSILLIDKLDDEVYILNETGELNFSNPDKWSDDRFEILHYQLVSTGVTDTNLTTPKVWYNNQNHSVCSNTNISQLTIYSISGKMILSSQCNQTTFDVPAELQNQSAIIVTNVNGKTEVVKAIL